jgi:hypothetical protein
LILLIAALCGLSIWGVAAFRSRSLTPAALLKRMPLQSALVVYLDFSALRRAGILKLIEGSRIAEEPEYQAFVRKTEFDYKQDLDTAMVAFAPTGKFLLLKGRFDWRSLRSYAEGESGQCYNSLCRLEGSTPDRRISFFPLQANLMAMAVSPDESAALRMQTVAEGPVPEVPAAPVWVSIPASVLKSREDLPAGTRMFARSIEGAETVTLAFAPEGNRVAARLDVRCHDERDAAAAAAALAKATEMLRTGIEREHQTPNPADFSGILAAGAFRSEGRRVLGYWPIERIFLKNVLGGGQ